VIARLHPGADADAVADTIRRWKHLSALTDAEQSELLTRSVVNRARVQLGMFTVVLLFVTAVIIALIIDTMTMDKLREIATLKLIGAPDRTIAGLVLQQALMLGLSGFAAGLGLIFAVRDRFPRTVALGPAEIAAMLGEGTVWEGGRYRVGDLRALRRNRIGFIFQFHTLLPFLDATDNVALAMTLAGTDLAAAREKATGLLAFLGVEKRAGAMPARLSGGEAQRVAIARALANDPPIILADEPTAALDSERARSVMDLLRRVAAERRAAVLVVTHDEKIFDRFGRMVALRDGRIDAAA
jgi:ABC-type lipoprotein export system ATPase subunit